MGFLLATINIDTFDKIFSPNIVESLAYFGPEIQVGMASMAIFLIDLFIPQRYSRHLAWLALLGCLWPVISVLEIYHTEPRTLFLGMTAIDPFANFFKLFFLLGTVPIVILTYVSRGFEKYRMGEYYGILLASVLAGMLMASSNHLLMAFLSLEFLSIASYILVGYFKDDRKSAEASLKYIIYGSVAAGIMVFGLSLFYGLCGTGDLQAIGQVLAGVNEGDLNGSLGPMPVVVTVALLLTFAGLAYKMATIPMHFWCPDVYEGAPTTITAFLSVGSKAAGFALAIRFLDAFHILDLKLSDAVNWPMIMIVVSILTMTFGNFAALWQTNLKRLFAYSSIAHAGYMMMGMAIIQSETYSGTGLIAYYLLAYLAMNLGAFAVVILLENRLGSVEVSSYVGLGKKAPFLCVALTLFLFSLIGIPPTAGFAGKYMLLQGVLEEAKTEGLPYYVLAVVALLNTAVSVYYYARIIKSMFLVKEPAGDDSAPAAEPLKFPALGTAVVVVFLFLTFYLFFQMDWFAERTLNLKIYS